MELNLKYAKTMSLRLGKFKSKSRHRSRKLAKNQYRNTACNLFYIKVKQYNCIDL